MKKLVNTVVGTALVASLVAGCSADESNTIERKNDTTKETDAQVTTVPTDSAETTVPVTDAQEEVGTEPSETVSEPVMEETIPVVIPEETTTTTTLPPTTKEPDIETYPDDCPNATPWA